MLSYNKSLKRKYSPATFERQVQGPQARHNESSLLNKPSKLPPKASKHVKT